MKNSFFAAMMIILITLTGCGSGDVVVNVSPTPIVSQILSDALLDGDIEVGTSVTTVRQGNTQSVFVGIDPLTFTETRAFLDFSLASIPFDALIDSAILDILVDGIQPPLAAVSMFVDLVSFPQPLSAVDFGRAFFATTTSQVITSSNLPKHVTIDVTNLMKEAQLRGLSRFQIRLLKTGATPGLVEINNTTGLDRVNFAPQLTIVYF